MDGFEISPYSTKEPAKDQSSYTISTHGLNNPAFVEHSELSRNDRKNSSFRKRFQAMTLAWDNIEVHTIPKGGLCGRAKNQTPKRILKNVSGIVKSGSLVAIMGSSGAGKTTLMNVLTKRSNNSMNVQGRVTLNGRKIGSEIANISAYIQQEDLFIPTLTVKEQLVFRALLRMDKSMNKAMRMERVEEVLKELNLFKCKDTLIGDVRIRGISGGEKKRLSFASEILTDPPLIFLDEPTSGLDSFLARNLISTLQGLASRGRTIIATIHQPSSEVFLMFDNLILMAEGEVAFMGPTREALDFFQSCGLSCPINYNPSEFYLDTLSIVPGQEKECLDRINSIIERFSSSERCKSITSSIKSTNDIDPTSVSLPDSGNRFRASTMQQFKVVLWRSWLGVVRDPNSLKIRAIQTIFISLIFGLIYLNQKMDQQSIMNINGFLFILVTNMSFSTQFIVVNVFPAEVPVFQREYNSQLYSTEIYFLCKTLTDIPFQILFPFIFTTIDYWMIGLVDDVAKYFIASGVVIMVSIVAASFGYLISCASSSVTVALALGPPLLIPLMLFGGVFVNVKSIPVYFVWLKYLSWFKYATEMLVIDQWIDMKNITCNLPPCITNGAEVLTKMGFEEGDYYFDLYMLFVLSVAFRIVAYILLSIRTKKCSSSCC